ncbi:transposase [uncultured Bacteroides sp.]|uniref:transposase n=1 Tax=uncultured Bacteroides sp. TaxID=162156 RepID=UPI002AA8B487|nr:transposase [uncultured Bacteroides sp.]
MECIFYVVKTGYQWRMLPSDFPSWELVDYYYRSYRTIIKGLKFRIKFPDIFTCKTFTHFTLTCRIKM